MANNILKVFEGEHIIITPSKPRTFNLITTPYFKPLDTKSPSFRFEAWYQEVICSRKSLSLFKLKLVKISSASVSPTLEVTAKVKVNYTDGSLLNEYPITPLNKVVKMSEVCFDDVIRDLTTANSYGQSQSTHHSKMQSGRLILIYKLMFYDDDSEAEVYLKIGQSRKSTSKLFDFVENITSMYDPAVLSDVVFKVGDKSFPSHKFILASHSPVFRKMFAHDFLESKTNSVTISDASPEIFELFLKYFYTSEIEDMSWNTLKDLYYLAHKYDVAFLKKECTVSVISILSVDLVCDILQLAYTFSDEDLKSAAIDFSVDHIKEVVTRDDWKELVQTNSMIANEVTVNFIPV